MSNPPSSRLATALVLCFLLSSNSEAAEENNSLPVIFTSDGSMVVQPAGEIRITQISDNVMITQGEIQISGDKAVLEQTIATGEMVRVTVNGSPVVFTQELNSDGEIATGNSDTLILYKDELSGETLVELVGNASINTPDSSANCAAIVYNADQALIPRSTGPCGGVVSTPSN